MPENVDNQTSGDRTAGSKRRLDLLHTVHTYIHTYIQFINKLYYSIHAAFNLIASPYDLLQISYARTYVCMYASCRSIILNCLTFELLIELT